MSENQGEIVRQSVTAAERGNIAAARVLQRQLPDGHPVTRLVALEVRHLAGEEVLSEAAAFAEDAGDYTSAWELVASLAGDAGDVERQLAAARALARLHPSAAADRRVAEAEEVVVVAAVARAEAVLAIGDGDAALAIARSALRSVPQDDGLRMLAVRAALVADRVKDATDLTTSLPDTAEGTLVKAQVAERLEQWGLAAALYRNLPESYPERCPGILRTEEQWRVANAPGYLQQAINSNPLRRRNLAALLAWEVPELAAIQAQPLPVFEDVVQLPEQGEIVTAARSGVMRGDPVTRRFSPDRRVGGRELQAILDRLAAALGRPAIVWCRDEGGIDCYTVAEDVDGRTAAYLVRRTTRGDEPCR